METLLGTGLDQAGGLHNTPSAADAARCAQLAVLKPVGDAHIELKLKAHHRDACPCGAVRVEEGDLGARGKGVVASRTANSPVNSPRRGVEGKASVRAR